MGEILETKTATYSLLEKNILLVVMKEDAVVDVPEVEENYTTGMRLTGENRYAALVDGRKYATLTNEAKEYSAQPKMSVKLIAQAIVVTSLASRLLANFLIKFLKQNKYVQIQLFTDYDAALNWLREKIKEEKKSKKISSPLSI